jgi:hypothetical protein
MEWLPPPVQLMMIRMLLCLYCSSAAVPSVQSVRRELRLRKLAGLVVVDFALANKTTGLTCFVEHAYQGCQATCDALNECMACLLKPYRTLRAIIVHVKS